MNDSEVSPLIATDRWSAALPAPQAKDPSMRLFGLAMLLGFGGLGTLFAWTADGPGAKRTAGLAMIGIGLVFVLWSLAAPRSLLPVYRGWMRFGEGLGTVVSTVLLALLYYLVVTPVGWVMRLSGTDPLDRRVARGEGSYWRAHPKPAAPEDYAHMS